MGRELRYEKVLNHLLRS